MVSVKKASDFLPSAVYWSVPFFSKKESGFLQSAVYWSVLFFSKKARDFLQSAVYWSVAMVSNHKKVVLRSFFWLSQLLLVTEYKNVNNRVNEFAHAHWFFGAPQPIWNKKVKRCLQYAFDYNRGGKINRTVVYGTVDSNNIHPPTPGRPAYTCESTALECKGELNGLW